MLTRIEIDGFKTFRGFSLDVPPFLVVLGRNASGKSNLFDAIHFLRSTSDRSLAEAVSRIRGEPHELLHAAANGDRSPAMSFAVEVLLDDEATDDFGDVAVVRHSRLRYELSLELRSARRGTPSVDRPERLFVREESVRLIRQKQDPWVLRHGGTPRERRNFARYSSRSEDFLLETVDDADGRRVFAIHQDGNAGRRRLLPAAEAVSSVLSSLATANDYPHLFALKKELESWGLLHLDPAALRGVNSFDDDETLAPNGANLANTIKRISLQTATQDRPDGVLSDIEADLSAVVPEVVGLEVSDDRARRQRQVLVRTRDDAPYTAGVASDGTLRALALLVALYDPESKGLICFEEPENGIYPQRLVDFTAHLRSLVYASVETRRLNPTAPLRQLLLSSHSPVILLATRSDERGVALRDDIAFFDSATLVSGGVKSRVSRARRVRGDSQITLSFDEAMRSVAPAEVESFEIWQLLDRA